MTAITEVDSDLSLEGERVLARVREGLFGADDAPLRIGRFVILRRLGAGGMGEVFLAADPELDRRVAIKLVRGDQDTASRQDALQREAQAVARLAHPHVVAVYEVGRNEGRVWVAMEYVEGQTLRRWLTEAPRGRAAILDAFLQAGRGLQAAHAAGVVHRDFKPDNVLVGVDGRVRVVDFGLARVGETSTDDTAFAGTPRYMAPELFAGGVSDARSDQYAYAVALWEAVCGAPPFAAANMAELVEGVARGRIDSPPASARVPRSLLRALEKALSPNPSARHRDVAALLDIVVRVRDAPRRRRTMFVMAGALGLGATAVAIIPERDDCPPGSERIDPVWNATRSDRVRDAIANATSTPEAATGTIAALDDFSGAWAETHEHVCEAGRGEASRELTDARMTCLDRALVRAGALVDLYAQTDDDRELAFGALDAVAALPQPSSCLGVGRPSEVVDACAADVYEQIDRARAMRDAGRVAAAIEPLRAAVASASSCEGVLALAEARAELATALADADRHDAEAELSAAAAYALEVDAPASLARAATRLAALQGAHRGNADVGFAWNDIAMAAARREGPDSDALIDALETRANLLGAELRADEAAAAAAEVLERRRRQLGPSHPAVAGALDVLAWVEQLRSNWPEALALHRQALALREQAYSPTHPACARTHNAIGVVLGSMDRSDEAQQELQLAVRMLEESLGPRHAEVATPLLNLADLHARAGRPAETLPLLARVEAIADDNPRYLDAVLAIRAVALAEQDDLAASEAEWRRLVDVRTVRFGEDDVRLVQAYYNLCRVLHMQDRARDALDPCRRAVTIDEAHSDPDDPAVFDTLDQFVRVALAAGEAGEAQVAAERAYARAARSGVPAEQVEKLRGLF
jgi:predicted Ser/Thr protein kinase